MWLYRTLPVATLCALLLAGSAWAQTEINHAKAIAGGVTPGDAPGYPVTISLAGSYKLMGILSVPNANTSAIVITANHVTLDLNGFIIHGTTVCTGEPVTSCTPSSGSGVGVNASGHKAIVVRNGQVFGMGRTGVSVGTNSRVEQVIVQSNGGDGIVADSSSVVTGCHATGNGGDGIFVNSGAVTNNVADHNGSVGIAANASTVVNNEAFRNAGVGLFLDTLSGYTNNVLNDNNGGNTQPQVANGIQMGTNICGGDTICP